MSGRVAILGGGVGGLSAAHELVQRGFEVDVFESRRTLGGKARSIDVPADGAPPPPPDTLLPGEHGFRFFPGFYKHLVATLEEIPFDKADSRRVSSNLVPTSVFQIVRKGDQEMLWPASFPGSVGHMFEALKALEIPEADALHFYMRLVVFLTSSEERRLTEYERQSWRHYVQVDKAEDPEKFEKYFSGGLTRSMVAARADRISARTGGAILLQLMFDLARPGGQVDRVLNAPTNDAWINPWQRYLTDPERWRSPNRPVQFHMSARIAELHFDALHNRVEGFTVEQLNEAGEVVGTERHKDFDYYVSALPVEVFTPLVTDAMKQADPSLAHLEQLETAWMNGIQFYLLKQKTREPTDVLKAQLKRRPVRADAPEQHVLGHTLYVDSTWALTSISQLPFFEMSGFQPPQIKRQAVQRILSVDISDWDADDGNGRTVKQLKRDEVKDGVWRQLKEHLNDKFMEELHDSDILQWSLDPSIQETAKGLANDEPLLINTTSSWGDRPEAVTAISNMFLAADYVRTNTDLATMEGANEAARRAVNGILDAAESRARRCRIWPLEEPWFFIPFKWYDRRLFRKGRPHAAWIGKLARWTAGPLWRCAHELWWVFHLVQDLPWPWRKGKGKRR
jgi:uncharacterized protein with NAD-binding domain and iron-sulfur cluster